MFHTGVGLTLPGHLLMDLGTSQVFGVGYGPGTPFVLPIFLPIPELVVLMSVDHKKFASLGTSTPSSWMVGGFTRQISKTTLVDAVDALLFHAQQHTGSAHAAALISQKAPDVHMAVARFLARRANS